MEKPAQGSRDPSRSRSRFDGKFAERNVVRLLLQVGSSRIIHLCRLRNWKAYVSTRRSARRYAKRSGPLQAFSGTGSGFTSAKR